MVNQLDNSVALKLLNRTQVVPVNSVVVNTLPVSPLISRNQPVAVTNMDDSKRNLLKIIIDLTLLACGEFKFNFVINLSDELQS